MDTRASPLERGQGCVKIAACLIEGLGKGYEHYT